MPIISTTIAAFSQLLAELGRTCGEAHELFQDGRIIDTRCSRIKPSIEGYLIATPTLIATEVGLRQEDRQAVPEFIELEELLHNFCHQAAHRRILELGCRAMCRSSACIIFVDDLVHVRAQLSPDLAEHAIRFQGVHNQPLQLLNIPVAGGHIASPRSPTRRCLAPEGRTTGLAWGG
jgi:hypothetical protein